MNKLIAAGVLLTLIWLPGKLIGQIQDAGLWLSAEGEFRLNPMWSVEGAAELRLHENLTEAGAIFAEAGIKRDLGRRWRLACGLRATLNQQLDRTYEFRSRIYADVRYRYNYGKLDFTGRMRYQQQSEGWMWDESEPGSRHYLRVGVEWRWRMSPAIRPYLAAEAFYPLTGVLSNPYADKLRYRGGLEYRFNKVHAMNIGFLYQQEMNVSAPERDYVTCLGYVFSPRW